MAGRRNVGQRYTLVFLRKGPTYYQKDENSDQLQLAHLQHLTKLQLVGKLVLNGPILAESDIAGVSVYNAGLEEARAMAEADPRVKAGNLIVEALPWFAVPSETDSE